MMKSIKPKRFVALFLTFDYPAQYNVVRWRALGRLFSGQRRRWKDFEEVRVRLPTTKTDNLKPAYFSVGYRLYLRYITLIWFSFVKYT